MVKAELLPLKDVPNLSRIYAHAFVKTTIIGASCIRSALIRLSEVVHIRQIITDTW
jgi:hypothetical protein